MAGSVKPVTVRRAGFLAGLAVSCLLADLAARELMISLHPVAIYTGALLFALILALTFFNARKKLPFLPLAKASTWLQIHLYLGWLSAFIFLLHARFRVPHGILEGALAAVFCVVLASGVFGLYVSRSLPPRMNLSGEPIIYERAAPYRLRIKQSVEDLVRKAETETDSSTLADYYVEHLRWFFDKVPSAFSALSYSERTVYNMMAGMSALNHYLNAQEREIADEIRDWVETKQNLDFQFASQRLLKLWLFVHIPTSYAVIILGAVHGCFALVYAGRL